MRNAGPTLVLQPVSVDTGCNDGEGFLVLAGGRLVALLVRLDDAAHGADVGKWFLEAGFSPRLTGGELTFAGLDAAEAWIIQRLGSPSGLATADHPDRTY